MNNIIKKGLVVLSAATLTSSINVNPNLIYDWNNCLNSHLYIVAPQWDVVDSFVSSNMDESCVITITVKMYDYQTFLKVVKIEDQIETTSYYSTNIYGYRIVEINTISSSETSSSQLSGETSTEVSSTENSNN